MQKVSALAPGAIAALRASVLELFVDKDTEGVPVVDALPDLSNDSNDQDQDEVQSDSETKSQYRVIVDGIMALETTDYEVAAARHSAETE